MLYHGHENDEVYNDLGQYCAFEIRDPDNEDNYMYVHRYFNEEDAKAASKEEKYNLILWLFFGIFGERRWLHTGCYGDLTYSTFDRKMIKPLQELIKEKMHSIAECIFYIQIYISWKCREEVPSGELS